MYFRGFHAITLAILSANAITCAYAQSSSGDVFNSLRTCYQSITDDPRLKKETGSSHFISAFDPQKNFMALPGEHDSKRGFFIVPFNGGEAAFIEAKNPDSVESGGAIGWDIFQYQAQGATPDKSVSLEVGLAPAAADKTLWNYARYTMGDIDAAPSGKVIPKAAFSLQGTEVEQALADEIVRRINAGLYFFKSHHGDPSKTLAAVTSCRANLSKQSGEFSAVFKAFDAAETAYKAQPAGAVQPQGHIADPAQ